MAEFKNTPFDPYAVLKIPEFRLLIIARFCVTLAIQIQAVAVGWQIYQITKDPLSLGLIGLAEALPALGVALYAGHVADSYSRKKVITACVSLLLFGAIILLWYSTRYGDALQVFGTLPIYAIIFLTGIARGFMGPAIFSFMPQLVADKGLYGNAVTWSSTTGQVGAVAGPALGGFIFALAGATVSFSVVTALILLGFIFYFFIASRPVPPHPEKQPIKESLVAGLKFVFSNQLILAAMSLDLFAVLFGGAVALLPIFAADILKTGPAGLGMLRAAPAVGSVVMSIYLTYRPIRFKAGKRMLFCVAGFGVCMILFGLSTSFWFSFVLLILSGVFDSISVIIRSTLMQTLTPEHMKGRVSAVNSIFVGSSNEIGAFESGFAAKLMGTATSVIFGGCMTLGVVGVVAWKADKLRQLNL